MNNYNAITMDSNNFIDIAITIDQVVRGHLVPHCNMTALSWSAI